MGRPRKPQLRLKKEGKGTSGKTVSKINKEKDHEENIIIRHMRIRDLAECYDIGDMAFTKEKTGTTLYRTWDESTLVEIFLGDSEYCLVAETEGNSGTSKVAGFVLGEVMRKPGYVGGYISWVVVRESYRRRGVGYRLVESCCKQMKDEDGVKTVMADTSRVNVNAIKFFKAIRFGSPVGHVYFQQNISEYTKKVLEEERVKEMHDYEEEIRKNDPNIPNFPRSKRVKVERAIQPKPAPGKKKVTVKVRELELKDLEYVYQLGENLFTREMDNLFRSWTEDEVVSFLVADREYCWVAEVNNKVVGFTLGTIIEKNSWKYGYLVWMAVDPSTQGAGVGRKLYDTFKESTAKEGARLLLLDTQESNIPAITFFQKLGFVKSEEHAYYTKILNDTPRIEEIHDDVPQSNPRRLSDAANGNGHAPKRSPPKPDHGKTTTTPVRGDASDTPSMGGGGGPGRPHAHGQSHTRRSSKRSLNQ